MVTMAQVWMDYTIDTAINIAHQKQITVPDNIEPYMDDILCSITSRQYIRSGLRSNSNNNNDPALDFKECLSSVHPRVKFTHEEEENNKIAFLDVLIERHEDGSLSTSLYRKPTNTNVLIRPESCHDPKVHAATFKGELCRATRLCSSTESLKREKAFIIQMYEDNGHDRKLLETSSIRTTMRPIDVRMKEFS